MGVKNLSFCMLLTKPQKHALSEFQLFTATWRLALFNHNVGSECVCHLTVTTTSGQRDQNSLPLK